MAKTPPITPPITIIPVTSSSHTLSSGVIGTTIAAIASLSYTDYVINVNRSLVHSFKGASARFWTNKTSPWGANKRCVYYFKIIKGNPIDIATSYVNAKRTPPYRAFSYYKGPALSTDTLYVGKYHSGCIRQRIKEYFGFGNAKTGALQLDYWLDSEEFELHICVFNDTTAPAIINAIEKLFIADLKPLIGKD